MHVLSISEVTKTANTHRPHVRHFLSYCSLCKACVTQCSPVLQQSRKVQQKKGFGHSREQRTPVWSLLTVFPAVRVHLSRITKLGVKTHKTSQVITADTTLTVFFLSPSSSQPCLSVLKTLQRLWQSTWVHGRTQQYIVKSACPGHILSAPVLHSQTSKVKAGNDPEVNYFCGTTLPFGFVWQMH